MVVMDEKSRVPPIDEAALERLSHALDQEGVVAAMLIGSQARGTVGPLSDVDIAVWHDPALDPRGRLDLQLGLADEAGRALGTDEIDIVLLNHAPPLMRHRAIAPSATPSAWSSEITMNGCGWRLGRSCNTSTRSRCVLSWDAGCGDG
jgi:predicted nucleotidyltransferase